MKMIRVAVVLFVVFGFFGLYREASAMPFAGNKMFPDVSRAEKTVWHCDGGETPIIMYRAIRPVDLENFRIFLVVFDQNMMFVMDNKTETVTNWFLGHSLKELKTVEAEDWLDALSRFSPNFYRFLRHKSNDCAKE